MGKGGSSGSVEISFETLGLIGFLAVAGVLYYTYKTEVGSIIEASNASNEEFSAGGGPSFDVTSKEDSSESPRSPSEKHLRSKSPVSFTSSASGKQSFASTVKRDKAKTFMEQQKEYAENLVNSKELTDDERMRGRLMEGVKIDEVRIHDIVSLRDTFPSADFTNSESSASKVEYHKIISERDFVLRDIVRKIKGGELSMSTEAFVRAGPRVKTHFDPKAVQAAIVTCGGLCPGLNNVIRELTHALYFLYGAKRVVGIRGGYHGFDHQSGAGFDPIELTLDYVDDVHHEGGTILASSRGGFDIDTIIDFLKRNSIDQLYVIGGDGTHRGANLISEECIKRRLNIAVVGIPKTIDNDVDIIDRSFGFTTSVEHAQAAIQSAKTEARCNLPNGIGIVKLMGRSAGFIAVHSTLASGDVDLCLVPEVALELEGPRGCLPFLLQRVRENGHAVVVVAEGAGEEILGESAEKDAGGNKKLPAIGEFLKGEISAYFQSNGMQATVKYIDPSYMIRSVPANASDSLLCMLLAHNAVHGCMAGYTAFSVGLVNNRVVYIPIPRLVATSPRVMDPRGRTWERVLAVTRQPDTKASMEFVTVNDRTTC
jgi:6-phosphofructokinase 1